MFKITKPFLVEKSHVITTVKRTAKKKRERASTESAKCNEQIAEYFRSIGNIRHINFHVTKNTDNTTFEEIFSHFRSLINISSQSYMAGNG